MSLGQRLRLLDARFAPPGQPSPKLKPAWVLAAVLLGVATVALLVVALVGRASVAFVLAPVGIAYGWVMGRLHEAKASATGRGVTREKAQPGR